MDANALMSSEDFGKLRDTYVIFITENDVMKRGKDACPARPEIVPSATAA